MDTAIAAVACVGIVSASGLAGLVLLLRHREKRFEHEPLHKLEERLSKTEGRVQKLEFKR